LARNYARIWRIGHGSPSRAEQRGKTARSIRGNRDTLGVHSETEEISNAESEATPHPNTETKKREDEIQCEIEVGPKRGDA